MCKLNEKAIKRKYSGNCINNRLLLKDLREKLEEELGIVKIEFDMTPKTIEVVYGITGMEYTNIKFYFDSKFLDIQRNVESNHLPETLYKNKIVSSSTNTRVHVDYADDDIIDFIIDVMIDEVNKIYTWDDNEEVENIQDTFFNHVSNVGSEIKTLALLLQTLDEEVIKLDDTIPYYYEDWVYLDSINIKSGDITYHNVDGDKKFTNFTNLNFTNKCLLIKGLKKIVMERMFTTKMEETSTRTNFTENNKSNDECCGECVCNEDNVGLKETSELGSIGDMVESINDKHVNDTLISSDKINHHHLKHWVINELKIAYGPLYNLRNYEHILSNYDYKFTIDESFQTR